VYLFADCVLTRRYSLPLPPSSANVPTKSMRCDAMRCDGVCDCDWIAIVIGIGIGIGVCMVDAFGMGHGDGDGDGGGQLSSSSLIH
jgi:hypothetical protein